MTGITWMQGPETLPETSECILIYLEHEGTVRVADIVNMLEWLLYYDYLDALRASGISRPTNTGVTLQSASVIQG